MKCPKCDIEMSIKASRYRIFNDDTPDKETELYSEQDMSCRNKACSNYGLVVETVRNKLAKA